MHRVGPGGPRGRNGTASARPAPGGRWSRTTCPTAAAPRGAVGGVPDDNRAARSPRRVSRCGPRWGEGVASVEPERVSELSDLLAHARASRSGAGGRAVIIRTASGMWCRELLVEFTERQRRAGAAPVLVSCQHRDAREPFAALRQLLAGLGDAAQPAGDDRFDELRRALPHTVPEDHGRPLFDELYEVLLPAVRRCPRVIVVDHAQWMDDASLRWFAHLVRRLTRLPLLVVLGVRVDDDLPARDALDDIGAQAACHESTLRPLSVHSARELVQRAYAGRVPDDPFVRLCHHVTGGVPAYLVRLIDSQLQAGLPPELGPIRSGVHLDGRPRQTRADHIRRIAARIEAAAVTTRLARQPERVRALAQTAALFGDGADLDIVADLLGTGPDRLDGPLAELVRVGVLRGTPPGGRLSFRTPELRDAVHDTIPETLLRDRHVRAARRLGDYGAPPTRVAEHLLRIDTLHVDEHAWAGAVLYEAGRAALEAGATLRCAEYARRALRDDPPAEHRARLLVLLGRAEVPTAPEAAARHLEEALRLLTDPGERAEAVLQLCHAQVLRQGDSVEAVMRPARDAAARLGELAERDCPDPDVRLRLRAIAHLGGPAAEARSDREARSGLDRAAAEVTGVTAGERELLAAFASDSACRAEPSGIALDLIERALAGEPPRGSASALLLLRSVVVLAWAGRLDEARTWAGSLTAAIPIGPAHSRIGLPAVVAHCLCADIALRAGNLAEALAEARTAGRLARGPELSALTQLTRVQLARIRVVLGQYDAATTMLRGALGVPRARATALGVRARCRYAAGDPRGALADHLECGRRLTELGIVNPALSDWRGGAGLALVDLDRRAEAAPLFEEGLEIARRWGAPAPIGEALRNRARIEGPRGAIRLLEESVAILEHSGARLQLAESLVESGRVYALAGQPAAARLALRRGMGLAQECGWDLLVERAHKDLLACGGRLRRTSLSGPGSLTPSERQIAELAAAGHTNRAIAESLCVTRGTVEVHLTHVYRKLGISGRTALSTRLASTQ
ncbi:LuxR C-terminal-related transcriptional regulator [Embleya sp. NPDC056575]|uniref:helix-turn-helix transcriptional regulator n=1 Tax=unclassified Embleya TaxID=2699296 RepID=UPI0036B2918F